MKKWISGYTVLILSGILAASSVKGQVNPSTAFYWENPYYINPAFVNTECSAYFSLSARKQWLGLSGSPFTAFGTGTFYWEKYRMQAGIKILNDKIGYLNSSDISLSYAYTVPLRNNFLNMGFSWSYQLQKTNRGEVIIDDWNDPALANVLGGKRQWNAGLGFEYIVDRSFRIGLSTQNMLSFFKREGAIFGGTNYLYGRYRTRIFGSIYQPTAYLSTASPTTYDMEWGVCLKQYENDFQVDGVMSFYLNHNTQKEKFQFSLLGRSTGEFGVLAGVKLISEMKILCSYDYNFKSLKGNTNGTFEVIITYPLFPTKCISDGY